MNPIGGEVDSGAPTIVWGQRDPRQILGDAAALRRAIANLAANARRNSSPDGVVTVSVAARRNFAEVAVRDTGIGIAATDLPHVFDRFYRGDSARSRATGGSGLGLFIVRAIVLGHGGEATAASAVGQGSVFTIRLPLTSAHSATVAERAPAPTQPHPSLEPPR